MPPLQPCKMSSVKTHGFVQLTRVRAFQLQFYHEGMPSASVYNLRVRESAWIDWVRRRLRLPEQSEPRMGSGTTRGFAKAAACQSNVKLRNRVVQ